MVNSYEEEDVRWMEVALEQARKAYAIGEVPVGALLVENGDMIAQAHNLVQTTHNATAHAELLALQKGCQVKGEKYLSGATLYVTLEPCPMCAMACFWTQVRRVVFATADPKRGYRLWEPSLLLPKVQVSEGILAGESNALLTDFFKMLRHKKGKTLLK